MWLGRLLSGRRPEERLQAGLPPLASGSGGCARSAAAWLYQLRRLGRLWLGDRLQEASEAALVCLPLRRGRCQIEGVLAAIDRLPTVRILDRGHCRVCMNPSVLGYRQISSTLLAIAPAGNEISQ